MVLFGEIFDPKQAAADWRQGLSVFVNAVGNLQQHVGEAAFLTTGIQMEPETLKYFYPGYDEYNLAPEPNSDGLLYQRDNSDDMDTFRKASKKLVIVGSTTAGGQTTIVRSLHDQYQEEYTLIPTATNRPRNPDREDEIEFHVGPVIPYLDMVGVRTTSYFHIDEGNLLSLQLFWNETVETKTSTWGRTYASLKHHFDEAINGPQPFALCTVDYDGLDKISAWMKRYHPEVGVLSLFVMSKISQRDLEKRIGAKRPPEEVKSRIVDARNDIRQTGRRDPKPTSVNPVCENQVILLNPQGEVERAIKSLHVFLQSLRVDN